MKKLTITSKNISQKQWSVLIIELNMIKEQWKPYANIKIDTPGLNKIISWGKRRHDTKEDKRNRKFVEQNQRP